MNRLMLLMLLVASFTICIAQTTKPAKQDKQKSTATKPKTYTCTMHPEILSNKPGKCPKCGMKLVEKKLKNK